MGNAAIGCCVGNVAAGGSAGAPVAPSADTSVSVGATSADAMLLLDGVELVCAPPELCSIPERGSSVVPEEEPAAEADEFVADVGPVDDGLPADVDDGLPADSDDELEVDDDESDDELEELESVGSANATAGVLATAAPMPSATANTPTRTMHCAFTAIRPFLAAKDSRLICLDC